LCCLFPVLSGCGSHAASAGQTATLSIGTASLAFGNVEVNTTATQSVTLTSTGTAPITITAATLTGPGFSLLGASFPVTLNPGQIAPLEVQFDPAAVGLATGQLTIASNSSTGATAAIGLSGTGTPAPIGTTYFLATAADGGNDSNDGLSPGAPWLSPNHAVNCGDVIIAAASTSYSPWNFTYGSWGTVTCGAGNNVAWLICAKFDGCTISGESGLLIDRSYWGVQGWEVHATGTTAASCFAAAPNYATPVQIHHIVFANDIANGCQGGGLTSWSQGTAGVDYLAIVGNIAYNAAQGNEYCYSGISVYQPAQSDSLPGTHIYIAGNFSWGNFEPSICSGGQPTDGEGVILDTFDGRNGLPSPYRAQAVVDNNILVANGGKGLEVTFNDAGTPPFASIYLRHNTIWGNNGDTNQSGTYCGELFLNSAFDVQAYLNLAATSATDGCGANPIYAYYVGSSATTTDQIYDSWGYSASGTNDAATDSAGFSYGPNNTVGTNPSFADPAAPGAPSCGSATSVPNCMATVIANFTPTTAAAAGFGYQLPGNTQVSDPLFPQWLCNVNLPSGLVTMGCPAGTPEPGGK